jgi:excisionase family DNA binding protein
VTLAVLTSDELAAIVRREIRAAVEELQGGAPEAMSSAQAARRAGVTPKTVRAWIEAGALPALRRGRRLVIRRADLEAYLHGEAPKAVGLVSSLTTGRG